MISDIFLIYPPPLLTLTIFDFNYIRINKICNSLLIHYPSHIPAFNQNSNYLSIFLITMDYKRKRKHESF